MKMDLSNICTEGEEIACMTFHKGTIGNKCKFYDFCEIRKHYVDIVSIIYDRADAVNIRLPKYFKESGSPGVIVE